MATMTEAPLRVGEATGYLHRSYAYSLAEYGSPQELTRSGGWILRRRIPEFDSDDAMGCYPLFSCRDWSKLGDDIEDLAGDVVSLALVTDPFGEFDASYLRECFRDVVIPFKEHFVADLDVPADTFVHPHHRRYARKALSQVRVEECLNPLDLLEDWVALYATLTERHEITGLTGFSKESFAKQLSVPGMVALRAVCADTTVGMTLWYSQQNVAYYHLGAYSPRGYELRASFALFSFAIDRFRAAGFKWLNLGAGAGTKGNADDGLTRFKSGWSTGTKPVYFCGRICDRLKYSEIVAARGITSTDYFPAYRAGEFG